MASVKLVLYTSKVLKNGEHPIMIRIIKDRKPKYISTGHSCPIDMWDMENNKPKKKHPNSKFLDINLEIKITEAKKLVINLENDQEDFTLDDFDKKYRNSKKSTSFYAYLTELIGDLNKTGRISYATSHRDLERIMLKFHPKDFGFSAINLGFLRRFEQFLREKNLKENTLGVYFRTLRAVYKKSMADGFINKDNYPFDEFKVSRFKATTKKRAIRKEDVQKIMQLNIEKDTRLYHSRNFFLFSYYCSGINFIDVASLTWKNITLSHSLEYERSKTGHVFNITLLDPALEILEYYKGFRNENYIFPYLDTKVHTTPTKIDNRLNKCIHQVNQDLKEIGNLAGIDAKLTTYVARHTFATTLKREGVSTSQIAELMGHEDERTTRTYLDSFDNRELYEATKKLL